MCSVERLTRLHAVPVTITSDRAPSVHRAAGFPNSFEAVHSD
jgi:hypothetical protein